MEELPPLISLHAIAGIRTKDTMQLRLAIGIHELMVLDLGSTRNFISIAASRPWASHSKTVKGHTW